MKDVLGCSTVLSSQVALCAMVVSLLGPLLPTCVTLPIVWRDPGSENARVARVVETGVVLFNSVLVSYLADIISICVSHSLRNVIATILCTVTQNINSQLLTRTHVLLLYTS